MEVSQLKTLIHVAELGSFSSAADRLGIAQSALSRQVRALEAELGAPLFTRHGRGVVPTDLGRRVLVSSSYVLNHIGEIRRIADESRSTLSGRVRFGMTPTVAEVMTVPIAKQVRDTQPQIALCMNSAFSGHVMDWLKRDLLDCCVSYDPDTQGAVRTRPILEERLLLVGGRGRGLRMDRPIPFAALGDEPLILPSPMHGLRGILERHAARVQVALLPLLEADSLGGLIQLVRSGMGSTVLPLAPIYEQVAAGTLTAAPFLDDQPTRQVVLTFPADRAVLPATRHVSDAFVSIARDLIHRGIWAGRMIDGASDDTSRLSTA